MRFPQKRCFILQSLLLVVVVVSSCFSALAFRASSTCCRCRRPPWRATMWNRFPLLIRPHARHCFQLRETANEEDNNNDSTQNRDESKWNLQELYSRIRNLQQREQEESQWMATKGVLRDPPAICFDALLPRQRLVGTTSDETFGRFLKELGISGIFVMTSLDYANGRRLRRDAVLCKIEVVDAPMHDPRGECTNMFLPTAVDFSILGIQRCRLVGPAKDMQARIGRWRRCYDPNGEEAVLGWGMERFVDSHGNDVEHIGIDTNNLCSSTWTAIPVQINDLDDNDVHDPTTVALCKRIPVLLDEWQVLASNEGTYENVDVVATARRRSGYPGLCIDAAALLRNVRAELGPIPVHCPTELALYGAALINPLPVLGVAPEIRGRILSASSAHQRLTILEWGIQRSIENLKGIRPL